MRTRTKAVAVATVAVAVVTAGALRRSLEALPMLSRSVPEAPIFRVAVASLLAASVLALWALALGPDARRALTDAIRHSGRHRRGRRGRHRDDVPTDPDTRGTAAAVARASLGPALDARGRARSPDPSRARG